MGKRVFIRSIGTDKCKDSKLMPRDEAMAVLRREYDRILAEHDNGSEFDNMDFDAENGIFEIEAEGFYQIMYLMEENTASGLEWFLNEISREAERADDFAKLYEYEVMDMAVYESTAIIRHLVGQCITYQEIKREMVNKDDLRGHLEAGRTLDNFFVFRTGQECDIYKAPMFVPGDDVLYIPDLSLNGVPTDRPLDSEEIDRIMELCYTGHDFMEITDGDVDKAEKLFCYCDWQHPSSAWDAGELDDEEE